MPRARSRSSAIAWRASRWASWIRRRTSGWSSHAQLGAAELQRQRDQPRLRAVVQVALDAPQLRRLRVDRLAARAREHVDPRPQRAPAAGHEHAVVQRDQRVGAAGRRQAQQRPGRPERAARPPAAMSAATSPSGSSRRRRRAPTRTPHGAPPRRRRHAQPRGEVEQHRARRARATPMPARSSPGRRAPRSRPAAPP